MSRGRSLLLEMHELLEGRGEICLGDAEVKVEEGEELLLHEVHLADGEDGRMGGPVLVLRRLVVQVLGCNDECGQEDTMASAVHALGSNGELVLEALEVDKGGQQGRGLDIGVKDQEPDKVVEGRDDNGRGLLAAAVVVHSRTVGGCVWGRREVIRVVGGWRRATLNDCASVVGNMINHLLGDRAAKESLQTSVGVCLWLCEGRHGIDTYVCMYVCMYVVCGGLWA
jgi:hypothetical protein